MTASPGDELRDGIGALVFPRSAALVGATPRRPEIIEGALRSGLQVWGVHPARDEVLGLPCRPSVAALPERPDVAVLLVGHRRVEAAFEEAVAAGVRAVVIPGLGSEAGPEAAPIARQIAARAGALDVALLGPNCMGVAAPAAGSLWLGTLPHRFAAGHVSAISQSGSVAEALLALGGRVGFRAVVSVGGEMARDAADVLGFLADDPGTQAIGLFLETVRRPGAFARALARCAEAEKPVVCLKVGRSAAGARAALAHTGAIVGSGRAFSALLRRWGAIEVSDFHDLVETLEVLGRRRRPRGLRIAGISESGGEAALLADRAQDAGIPFEPLAGDLAARLVGEFPNYGEPQNPLDAWAVDDVEVVFPRSLELLAGSGAYDVLVAQIDASQHRGEAELRWCELIVEAIGRVTAGTDIFPAVTTIGSGDPPDRIVGLAGELDVAMLRGARNATRALAAVACWRPAPPSAPPTHARVPLDDLLATAGALPEHESAIVLERYGIAFAPHRRARDPGEAAALAAELGFPVVVKVDGPAHKSAVGGVAIGLMSGEAVAEAAERLGGRVIVARQLPPGPEAFCGMTRDEQFGAVLAVGWGGARVESLSPAVSLAPVSREQALELVREAGLPASAEPLADVLVALGRIAEDHPHVREIDVNPLILGPDGPVAVDALVVLDG
ncbi:MAG TPA: acetate--CoA ligase family protein [Solirubrobacteraceae bacterium]